jgi:hypothetical protein
MDEMQKLIANVGEKLNDIESRRKANKENFNFFSAIVSGKHSKDHIEKYHSNFIAYLLNPKGGHDFNGLFLRCFFDMLKKKFGVNDLPNVNIFTIEREKPTAEGRSIDISLEANDWIIFIENKIWSGELKDQMNDYCKFAKDYVNNGVGIYLTLNGDHPGSIDKTNNFEGKVKVINLSYSEIIQWLKCCCEQEEIVAHLHVLSALKQYITIIENLLKIMKENKKAILDLVTSPANIENAMKLLENVTLEEVKVEILRQLKGKIELLAKNDLNLNVDYDDSTASLGKIDTGFWFYEEGWKHCIYFYFGGDENYEKLYTSIGYLIGGDRLEKEEVVEWNGTLWSNILEVIPNIIKIKCKIYAEKISKIEQ